MRRHSVPVGVALASLAATLVVAIVPAIDFAYRRPSLHVALETAAFLIALLGAFLVLGRFLRSGAGSDLALACALAALAGASLVAAVAAVSESLPRFGTWAPLIGRTLGSLLFAAAAFLPAVSVRRRRRAAAWGLAALGLALVLVVAAVAAAGDHLPVGVETEPAGDPGRPNLDGHVVVLAVQLVSIVLFAAAAVGFSSRATRTQDELLRWLAVASVFAGVARLNYFLYPSLYSDWVYTGDAFWLLFYGTLLVGAAREIRSYWEDVAYMAVLDERRRIARDLHDGVAQELSFIQRRLRSATRDDLTREALVAAAQRGLEDLRHAIGALTRPVDQSLDAALEQALRPIAARNATRLDLDLSEGVRVPAGVREELVRIACEAVANAATHSGARTVTVELADVDGVQLRVHDDGAGFDPRRVTTTVAGGFGLASMRQRAEHLGARLVVDSSVGMGTRIEVDLPHGT